MFMMSISSFFLNTIKIKLDELIDTCVEQAGASSSIKISLKDKEGNITEIFNGVVVDISINSFKQLTGKTRPSSKKSFNKVWQADNNETWGNRYYFKCKYNDVK